MLLACSWSPSCGVFRDPGFPGSWFHGCRSRHPFFVFWDGCLFAWSASPSIVSCDALGAPPSGMGWIFHPRWQDVRPPGHPGLVRRCQAVLCLVMSLQASDVRQRRHRTHISRTNVTSLRPVLRYLPCFYYLSFYWCVWLFRTEFLSNLCVGWIFYFVSDQLTCHGWGSVPVVMLIWVSFEFLVGLRKASFLVNFLWIPCWYFELALC